jgi:D-xylose transport system substrate-binding protein
MKNVVILMLIVLTILTGCSQNKKYKIGFLYPSKDRMRFVKETNFFSERVKQLGAEAFVVAANDNESLQLELGYKMLNDQNIDLLIIAAVNGNTIAPLVRKAKNEGIPVIAYNMLINNVDYDIFFSGDNAYLAQLLCQSAIDFKPKGNYVIIGGDRFDRNGVELKLGIDSILKPYKNSGDINVIYDSYIEAWNRESAAFEFNQVVSAYGSNIDVVLSCNDLMADGVIDIIDKNHITKPIFIAGQDADIIGVRNIYNGKQSMSVYHPAKAYGYGVADLAMALLNGKKPKELANTTVFNGFGNIPNLRIKSVKITADNINHELVETGEYTWQQIKQ